MGDAGDKKKAEATNKMMNNAKVAASAVKPPVYDIIGRRLREYYDEVAHQPVPDRFLELMNRLETKPSKKEN